MEAKRVRIEIAGPVARIILDHAPTMNAISLQMVEEIREALPRIQKDARVLVVTGANGHFSSGADLSPERGVGSKRVDAGYRLETHFNPLMTDLRNLSIPWISAVPGAAAGVGCAIALSADMIIAHKSGYFLQAFRRIGLVPDGGSAFVLTRGAGRARAMEMMLLGDKIPAAVALDWGLINRCVDDGEFDAVVNDIAERLGTGPTIALALARKSAWVAVESGYAESLAVERRYQGEAGNTGDFLEGVKAFQEKRRANFNGS